MAKKKEKKISPIGAKILVKRLTRIHIVLTIYSMLIMLFY